MDKNIIIDNGTYDLKFGSSSDSQPTHVPNCLIRTSDKRVHLGESLASAAAAEQSGVFFKRPIEHGQLTQWIVEKQIWDSAFDKYSNGAEDDLLLDANLIYCEAQFTLSKFQNNTDQVLFEEYGVSSLYRGSTASLAPWLTSDGPTYTEFQLVIDCGYDATYVTPMVYGLPFYKAIKKMPIAGRFLNGYLREVISFRHYNVTDEPVLVNNIKEATCFVTSDYNASLAKIERLRKLKAVQLAREPDNISTNYVLPDYKTTATGYSISDRDVAAQDPQFRDTHQILKLFDERFAIPEVIFQPELCGVQKAGLVKTILESLAQVPALIRPLLCANMVVSGGTFNLPGFKERLAADLKQEIPIDNEIRMFDWDKNYADLGWYAGQQFFAKDGFKKVCVTKEEYQELGAEYTQEKFGFKG